MYDTQVTEGFLQYNTNIKRGHTFTLLKNRFQTDFGKFSFNNRVVDHWNNLPEHVVNSSDILSFERTLDKIWEGSSVMFDHNTDFNDMHALTKHRRTRSAHPAAVQTIDLNMRGLEEA